MPSNPDQVEESPTKQGSFGSTNYFGVMDLPSWSEKKQSWREMGSEVKVETKLN